MVGGAVFRENTLHYLQQKHTGVPLPSDRPIVNHIVSQFSVVLCSKFMIHPQMQVHSAPSVLFYGTSSRELLACCTAHLLVRSGCRTLTPRCGSAVLSPISTRMTRPDFSGTSSLSSELDRSRRFVQQVCSMGSHSSHLGQEGPTMVSFQSRYIFNTLFRRSSCARDVDSRGERRPWRAGDCTTIPTTTRVSEPT